MDDDIFDRVTDEARSALDDVFDLTNMTPDDKRAFVDAVRDWCERRQCELDVAK